MVSDVTAQPAGVVRHRWLVPLVVWGSVAVAIAALAVSGELDAILSLLRTSSLPWVGGLLLIGICLPLVHARRWQSMLRSVGHDISLRAAVTVTTTSSLQTYASPGGYVWAPAKGLLARQFHGVGLGRSLPTMAAEQGLDALALLLGTSVGLLLVGPATTAWLIERVDAPSGLVMLLVLLALVLLAVLVGLIARHFGGRFVEAGTSSFRMLADDRSLRGPILLLTGARWLLDLAAVWVAARAVGLDLSLGGALLLSNLPLLVGLVSPMPGGLGFREGAMVAVAGALRLTISSVLAAAVLHRFVLVAALPILLGLARITGGERT